MWPSKSILIVGCCLLSLAAFSLTPALALAAGINNPLFPPPSTPPKPSHDDLRDFVLSLQNGDDGGGGGGGGGGFVPPASWRSDQQVQHHSQHPTGFTPQQQQEKRPSADAAARLPASSAAVVDLSGKIAFVAGVSDANGFGWAIAKALHKAGATILVGTWVPMVLRFEKMLSSGSLDADRRYDTAQGPNTGMMDISKVYPLDVAFDEPADIPEDVKTNRRFWPLLAASRGFSISEVAAQIAKDFGRVDILVHSIAHGPEVFKPLLATTRKGYLTAQGSSAYSLVSMVQKFGPLMLGTNGAVVSLTYIASQKVIPGYGGGMSSSKASLESDTRTLAFEAGKNFGIRVNTISAGPLKSRAATAIKKPKEAKPFIDYAIAYSKANAPLSRDLLASDVADAALFLLSPMSQAVTGTTLYVDNGLHVMGMAADSSSLTDETVKQV